MFCLSLIICLSGCFTSIVNSEYHVWKTIYRNNTVSGQQIWPKNIGDTPISRWDENRRTPRKTKPPDTLASRTWFVSHGQSGFEPTPDTAVRTLGTSSIKWGAKS